jgi:mannosyltransferase OCH1-like enzyme
MLGSEWQIRALHNIKGRPGYFRDFIEDELLPENFDNMYQWQQKSDLIRLSLLKKYGGVWMDTSIILFQSIDE